MSSSFKTVLSLFATILFGFSSVITANASDLCQPDKLTFAGWEDWQQITLKPVRSIGHSNNWVGIFVNEHASGIYLGAGALYPECAAIVKPIYTGPDGQSIKKLTIMVKMPAGFDDENGNWWYASSDPSGTITQQKLRRGECISCHEQAASTDYLFSEEVLEAVTD